MSATVLHQDYTHYHDYDYHMQNNNFNTILYTHYMCIWLDIYTKLHCNTLVNYFTVNITMI